MKRFLVFLMLLAAPLLAQSPGARQMQEIYSSTGQVKVDGNLAANPFVSTSANPAQSGFIRGANNDQVCWRNAANTADICIYLDSSIIVSKAPTNSVMPLNRSMDWCGPLK